MDDETELICVFIGSKINVQFYKERLEENGIPSLWRDDSQSGSIVGMGGTPDSVELLVENKNVAKARVCIEELQKKH
ncbi:putative signal transducing protein [Labilibaculum sp.]|uniref:putative signal transducing protein n=1 Tax=Labilibaculum sp. TaxID=2060723 RepID=UPI003562C12E